MSEGENKPLQARPEMRRRGFLNTAAAAGLAGISLAACSDKPSTAPAAKASGAGGAKASAEATEPGGSIHLKPGELDTYYGLWSGG
ncbi:MAG: TAT-dependent nitrous-oxide reductase, partial [Comamonadaceae bacterium]